MSKAERTARPVSDIMLQGLSVWLTGGLVFWAVEMLTVLAGLPYSWDYKFVRDGVSFTEALGLTLLPEKIAAGFLLYMLTSLLACILCSVAVLIFSRRNGRADTALVHISIYLALIVFTVGGLWINMKYVPDPFLFKGIFINVLFIIVCAVLAYINAKLLGKTRVELLFPNFVALASGVSIVLLGGTLVFNSFAIALSSFQGAVSLISVTAAGLLVFIAVRWGLLTFSPRATFQTAAKWVFAAFVVSGVISAGVVVTAGTSDSSDVTGLSGTPNIVFIVMDTARADHFSCYGYNRKTSPNIDRISAEGIRFGNAISPSSWTLPSHASMFTGLTAAEHGIGHESSYLPEEIDTMAEILKDKGYQTIAYSNNPWVSFFTGLSGKFDDFQEGWKEDRYRYMYEAVHYKWLEIIHHGNPAWTKKDAGAARTNRYVLEWLEKNHAFPFFLFINYMEPHLPYHPPEPYFSVFLPDGISSEEAEKIFPPENDIRDLVLHKERGAKELAVINALYDGEIKYLDGKIGEIYDQLKKLNVLDNTMFIVVSDHGDNLGDHGLIGHAYGLYNTLIRVPLIIRYPAYFEPGLVVDDNVQTTDIFYTVMEAAGIKRKPSAPGAGRSFNRRIREHDFQQMMISEHDRPINSLKWAAEMGLDASHIDMRQQAIMSGVYKYILTSKGGEKLFDLAADPGETVNILRQHPETAEMLKGALEEYATTVRPAAVAEKKLTVDEETKQRLRSLGYIK